MAFSNGIGDRTADDLRFRNPQSPRDDSPFSYNSPLSPLGGTFSNKIHTQAQSQSHSSHDARASLHRRFTTNALPTLSPIGQQRRLAAEPQDQTSSLEKKKLEHEYLREQRRRFEAEMALLDLQQKNGEDEIQRLADSLGHATMGGRQSEPTTPPEYRENGLTSVFPRNNRYSTSSINSIGSPPGLTRQSRAGSQLASPPADVARPYHQQASSTIPSRSVPSSRRHSDEEDEEEDWSQSLASFDHRAAANLNRNSMPVTGRGRDMPDLASVLGHLPKDLLVGDEDDKQDNRTSSNTLSSPTRNTFLQLGKSDDQFPVLIPSKGPGAMHLGNMAANGSQTSETSAALDPASSTSAEAEGGPAAANGWSSFGRHQRSQQSLPMNHGRPMSQQLDSYGSTPIGSGSQTPTKTTASNRHSMGATYSAFSDAKRSSLYSSPSNQASTPTPPKLQSSYSTNDIPTVKNVNGTNGSLVSPTAGPKTHAEQHFHNHNASIGRIPPGAVHRQSRDLSATEPRAEEQATAFRPFQSVLQPSAAPFGPTMNSPNAETSDQQQASDAPSSPTFTSFQNTQPLYNNSYGMQMMPGMNGVPLSVQTQWQNPVTMYQQPYGMFQQFGQMNLRGADSQARVVQARRAQNGEDHSRFAHVQLDQIKGEIYSLCKDQHGCRFLQKQLESGNAEHVQAIFAETASHVVELMTDPFGNYLCQKLLEHATDEQRTVLIRNAAPRMHPIAVNQHGTRALQKMIEFISSREQVQMIIDALRYQVVALIQDLNGNHVIQKCLNHLSPEDAQFIFDAVGGACVTVGTHRHGCCVLQRCIDHASGHQKAELIRQITVHSYRLVQDPFGNYVVQYILDLDEDAFSQPLCLGFIGQITELSKQKFSSNVIEKCIRTSDDSTRRRMVEEMMNPVELERLLKDSYANYVVQTALEYVDAETKGRLIETIRPLLPGIKSTPHGKRISSKIADHDGGDNGSSGHNTPRDMSSPGPLPLSSQFGSVARRHGTEHSFRNPVNSFSGMTNGFASPHRPTNASNGLYGQTSYVGAPVQQQPFPAFGRMSHQPQQPFMNFF
ncbi:MAG: hypothetical protein M1820_010710 [Bogoriella megaspora]|nr:MAG: hypothetical protein M1820_010710 [Bogoriella megaspora]